MSLIVRSERTEKDSRDGSSHRRSLSPFILFLFLSLACLAVPLLQVPLSFSNPIDDHISRFIHANLPSLLPLSRRLPRFHLPLYFGSFVFFLRTCPTISIDLDLVGDSSRDFRASGRKTFQHFLWVFRTSNQGRQLGQSIALQ